MEKIRSRVIASGRRFAAYLPGALTVLILAIFGLGAGAAPSVAARTAPSWKIETIIYLNTDLSYTDSSGGAHHLVASMTFDEMKRVADSAATFVRNDIPALTSGRENPSVTIKTVQTPLDSSTLTLDGYGGWTPSPLTTTKDQDPGFDSYLAVWEPNGFDTVTNSPDNIARAGGLTWNMGTAPLFSEIEAPAIGAADRNVFKHEWGHGILFYYDAVGTAPKPAVDNHHPENYVTCHTNQTYVLQDDSDINPIPNSIFNSTSGFTHDYYSGVTALKTSPNRCLGITRTAWASGGPITKH